MVMETAEMEMETGGGTVSEEGLRDWFGKSKSKGGKPGWVQVVSGKPVLVNQVRSQHLSVCLLLREQA